MFYVASVEWINSENIKCNAEITCLSKGIGGFLQESAEKE